MTPNILENKSDWEQECQISLRFALLLAISQIVARFHFPLSTILNFNALLKNINVKIPSSKFCEDCERGNLERDWLSKNHNSRAVNVLKKNLSQYGHILTKMKTTWLNTSGEIVDSYLSTHLVSIRLTISEKTHAHSRRIIRRMDGATMPVKTTDAHATQ